MIEFASVVDTYSSRIHVLIFRVWLTGWLNISSLHISILVDCLALVVLCILSFELSLSPRSGF